MRLSNSNEFTMTRHAEARVQQRGVRMESIEIVLREGDMEFHAGEGLMSLQLSRKRLSQLAANSVTTTTLENAKDVVLLIDYSTLSIVTVMHARGRWAKRHSRQFPTRSRRVTRRSAESAPLDVCASSASMN